MPKLYYNPDNNSLQYSKSNLQCLPVYVSDEEFTEFIHTPSNKIRNKVLEIVESNYDNDYWRLIAIETAEDEEDDQEEE